jgi:type VI secretion system protein ImpL
MGSPLDQIKSHIGVIAIVSLYGIASLLVVFLGPSFGLGLTEQVIIIALLLLTWPIAMLINHYRKRRRASRDPGAEAVTQAESTSKRDQNGHGSRVPSHVYDELTRGVQEVVQWLAKTRLSAVRRSDPVYSLPWFMVAGLPHSGKTSLLLSSGMDFHTLPTQRRSDQNVIRPTRDVDWRVTDWCVLLDTTGRYQTEGPDGDEWSVLVETIKKYRKRRPIDGLLVTAHIGDLLASSEAEIEQQAKILRARLDEVNARVQARFPVYLVFTHCDSIEGFEEFFPLSDTTERGEVWGATIPLEQSASAHARFDVEFDYLYDTLVRYRLLRLSAQESSIGQLMVFDFPVRFASARRKLGLFTSSLFRPNPFSESPLLRGFYFTSSAAGNDVALRGPATAVDTPDEVAIAGQGHFTERLFNEVLRRDRDLASSFQAGRENPQRWRNVMLAAAAAFVLFLIVGLILSFSNNAALISEASKLGRNIVSYSITTAGKDPSITHAMTQAQFQEVDRLRQLLVKLDENQREWPPLYFNSLFHRFGLYSGNTISPYLRAIYFEAINQQFFKPTIVAIEADLQTFRPAAAGDRTANGNSPPTNTQEDRLGRYYDLLKAYLMLSERYDISEESFLAQQLDKYWRERAPEGMEVESRQQLYFYASQAQAEDAPHIKADGDILKRARSDLADYPLGDRYYKRITTEMKILPVRLAAILEDKRGGLEGSRDVRGVFTLGGYQQMRGLIKEAPRKAKLEDWVVGDIARDQRIEPTVLEKKYFHDYNEEWREFLEGIKIKPFSNPDEAKEQLKILAQSNGPIVSVMNEVARQTKLSGSGSSWWPFGSKSVTIGNNEVEKEFAPVIKFVSAEGDRKMSAYVSALAQLRTDLNAASDQAAQAKALSTAEASINQLLDGFESAPAKAAAGLLRQPLESLRTMISGDIRDQIEKEWNSKLRVSSRSFERLFPFEDSSGEVPLNDLSRLLNPSDGDLTKFVKTRLKDFVDDEWKIKQGTSGFSQEFTSYLANARRLQKALFPNDNREPGFSCVLALVPATDQDFSIDVNGQLISRNSPEITVSWPVRQGQTSVSVSTRGSDQPVKTFGGQWWLFRMLTEGSPSKGSDNKYLIHWGPAGAKLQPPSETNDPFELSQTGKLKLFRDFRAPEHTR